MNKILEALKHAERRLNEIPHCYDDTNFKLISEAIKEAETKHTAIGETIEEIERTIKYIQQT